jgi:enolase-phosphatase E1
MTATITHVLLDIEGTTCPVSFVAEVLFPYARERISGFLRTHGNEPEIAQLIRDVEQAWSADTTPEAVEMRQAMHQASQLEAVGHYLQLLIDRDIKLSALKDLQGHIWEAGYHKGDLIAPLFEDVPAALQRWQQQGLVLAVYSSGSIPAQKLLYGHSQAGDLCPLFSHWFDTRTGPKKNAESYRKISAELQTPANQVLFISDCLAELNAASETGMAVLFSDRGENPSLDCGRFERISNYSQLDPSHGS